MWSEMSALLAFCSFLLINVFHSSARKPPFSWDSVQVYNHMCNKSGPFNGVAVHILAKFAMVTIEKGQGSGVSDFCAEDKIVAAAKQIEPANSSVYILFSITSVLDWNQYRIHQLVLKHPDWWLKKGIRRSSLHTGW